MSDPTGRVEGVTHSVPLDHPYDEWTADVVYLLADHGRPVLMELRIRPTLPEWDDGDGSLDDEPWWRDTGLQRAALGRNVTGITSRLLRAVRPPALDRQARELVEAIAEGGPLGTFVTAVETARVSFDRPGRAGRSDEEYALWAARYVERLTSRRPVADLAEAYGLKQSQVRDRLRAARVRGLLTKTTRGRARGALTKKGLAALAAVTEESGGRHGVDQEEPT